MFCTQNFHLRYVKVDTFTPIVENIFSYFSRDNDGTTTTTNDYSGRRTGYESPATISDNSYIYSAALAVYFKLPNIVTKKFIVIYEQF